MRCCGCVSLADLLNSKVVDDEEESDWMGAVAKQSGGVGGGVVAEGVEELDETEVGKDAGLW